MTGVYRWLRRRWFRRAMAARHAARAAYHANVKAFCLFGVGRYRVCRPPGGVLYVVFEVGPREGYWRPVGRSFFYRVAARQAADYDAAWPRFSDHYLPEMEAANA